VISSNTQNVARRFIQAWTAGRREIVDDLAAEDLVVDYTHFPEPARGPEAFKAVLAETHRYFPDLTLTVDDVVSDGNRAVVRWTYRGTFRDGEMFGVEASGQEVEVAGVSTIDVSGGAVQREQGIVDNLTLMMQIGAMPNGADSP
jgi:steroid delta-isomerase-like uncharacterized protein